MDKLEKIGFTAILSIIFSWLGIVAIPLFLLILLQIIDYITGLLAAKYRNEKITSYRGFRGIAKKICMWLLVVVGGVMDWLIAYATANCGLDININFVIATVVCVWLICNEIISLLENMIDIGVSMPPFLLRLAKNIQTKVETAAETAVKEDTKND